MRWALWLVGVAALEMAVVGWLSAGQVPYERFVAWGVTALVAAVVAWAQRWRPEWLVVATVALLTMLLLVGTAFMIPRLGIDKGMWAPFDVPLAYLSAVIVSGLVAVVWLVPATLFGRPRPRSALGWASAVAAGALGRSGTVRGAHLPGGQHAGGGATCRCLRRARGADGDG